jgi:hypothetical protein
MAAPIETRSSATGVADTPTATAEMTTSAMPAAAEVTAPATSAPPASSATVLSTGQTGLAPPKSGERKDHCHCSHRRSVTHDFTCC